MCTRKRAENICGTDPMESLMQELNAEWVQEAAEWIKANWIEASTFLALVFAICRGIYKFCRGVRKKWHRRVDERHKVDAMFALSGNPSNLNPEVPSQFLREEFQVVGFNGRERELDELTSWTRPMISRDKNLSIVLLTGGPGKGKSRLARRLCELAREWNGGTWISKAICLLARRRGCKEWNGRTWIAGFLKEDAEPSDFPLLLRWRRPALLVIDYAERRTEQVEKLVRAVLTASPRKYPVRILLIARAKDEGWWSALENVFGKASTSPFGIGRVKWQELNSIKNDPGDRCQEFKHALRAFRKALGKNEVTAPSNIPNDLSRARDIEVLDIHIAALLTAYGDDSGGGTRQVDNEKHLLGELVEREGRAWTQAVEGANLRVWGLQGEPIRRAIAWLATTDGINNESEAFERLALLPYLQHDAVTLRVAKIAQALYPSSGEEEWWGGVGLDRLTTWLTYELDEMIEAQATIVASLPDVAFTNLLRHLTWRAQRYEGKRDRQVLITTVRAGGERGIRLFAQLGAEIGDPTGKIVADILSEMTSTGTVRKVLDYIDTPNVSLRESALSSTETPHGAATGNMGHSDHA